MPIKKVVKIFGGLLFKALFSVYPFLKNTHITLMYHRVVESMPRGIFEASLYVTAATFEMHMRELRRFFNIMPLADSYKLDYPNKGVCTITFDDGWADNYDIALPIMKKYQIPATIFLTTAKIDSNQGFWFENLLTLANESKKNEIDKKFIGFFNMYIPSWNPSVLSSGSLTVLLSFLKRLPANLLDKIITQCQIELNIPLSCQTTILHWTQILEMGQFDITFGSHGLHHFILPTLDLRARKKEIFESLQILRDSGAPFIPWFSYPNGDWDYESIGFLRDAGYEGAATTRLGYNYMHANPFLLNRIGLHEYISHTPYLFWFRLLQAFLTKFDGGRENGPYKAF